MHPGNAAFDTLKGKRILLVEENDQLYRALTDALQDAGCEVLGAAAFMPRGMGLLPLTRIDVAVIDVANTQTAMTLVRELRRGGIGCVLIAPHSLSPDAALSCRHLSKPFSEQQLLATVEEALPVAAELPAPTTASEIPSTLVHELAALRNRSVLLLEDEYVVALGICEELERAGAIVIGPVASVESALALLEDAPPLDAAIVDIRLRDTEAFAVADVLADRSIPYVFATGYERNALPPRFQHVPWCPKPFDLRVLASALETLKS